MTRLARELLNAALITLGIFSAGMGLHGFLLSSGFIDGGVTGVSMLLEKTTGLPLSLLIPLLNLPFVGLGFRHIGIAFALRSALAIAGLAVVLAMVHYPDVTQDPLLTAVFGGAFIGAGIGLAIRGGAVLDGTEIVALLVSKRSHLLRVGDVILGLNVLIFLAAMFFLGIEEALYSILTYMAAARTLDFVVHGLEKYTAITIISERSREIRDGIKQQLRRGVTVFKGTHAHDGRAQEILYCVVTRLEIGGVKEIVRQIDPAAFVVTHVLADAQGGVLGTQGTGVPTQVAAPVGSVGGDDAVTASAER